MNNNAKNTKVSENNARVTEVSENKVFSEEFAISSVGSTELTHIDKDGVVIDKFQYKSTDKDGNVVWKSTNNLTTMQVINSVQFFANVGKLSNKAIATECGRVTAELAKSEGYKTPADMLQSIFPELSHNTLNQYRRVGQFFCIRETVEKDGKTTVNYRYRAGIDESVNITNLTQVISLAKLPENFEKLKKEEIDKLYSVFYKEYIESGKINLNLPQSDLKKQIKTILSDNSAIDTTFTEKTEEKAEKTEEKAAKAENSDKNADSSNDSEITRDYVTDSPKKVGVEAIIALTTLFAGNNRILALLAKITEEVEKLPDENVDIVKDSDNSKEEQ